MYKPRLTMVASALAFTGVPTFAQQQQAPPPIQEPTKQAAPQSSPTATQGQPTDGRIRIYVSDS